MDQKKKPARIRWTTAWRRNNKKTEVHFEFCIYCRLLKRASVEARSLTKSKDLLLVCLLKISRREDSKRTKSPRSLVKLLLRKLWYFYVHSIVKLRTERLRRLLTSKWSLKVIRVLFIRIHNVVCWYFTSKVVFFLLWNAISPVPLSSMSVFYRFSSSLRNSKLKMPSYNDEEKESMFGYVLKVSGPCKWYFECNWFSSGCSWSYVWYKYVRISPCWIWSFGRRDY